MTILLNFQNLFNNVSTDPIHYRIESLNVALNTHIGLYKHEMDTDSMSVYMLIKSIIKNCACWYEVENKLKALQDFYNFFHIENSLSIEHTESILKFSIYRGYFSNSELDNIVKEKDMLEIHNIFKELGSNFLKNPPEIDSICY
jgi:hypothetical protein